MFLILVGRAAKLRAWHWAPAAAFVGLALPVLWPDPERAARRQQEADAAMAREESAALAHPVSTNASSVTALNFKWLHFLLPEGPAVGESGEPSYGKYIPARIKRFDGSSVRIRGFMLPTRNRDGKVSDFLILPNQTTCCFGRTPSFCEFITARMLRGPVQAVTDQPLLFEGVLHVGDVYVNKSWSALYTMDCTKVVP